MSSTGMGHRFKCTSPPFDHRLPESQYTQTDPGASGKGTSLLIFCRPLCNTPFYLFNDPIFMKELLQLEKEFQRGRLIAVAALVCGLVITLTAVGMGYYYSDQAAKRIYVVNRGEAIEATCGDVRDNRLAEVRYQTRKFHELFFTVSPDQKSIDDNLKKALFLCDESARKLYKNLKESNYYREMIEGNVLQQVVVDSMQVDMRAYPYRSVCFLTLTQNRATATSKRQLITSGDLVDVNRSENSPNGLLIRNFHIEQSKLISETSR